MQPLTPAQVKEIAEELGIGQCCYYHKEKGTLLFLPDFAAHMYEIDELYADDIAEVENNSGDYIVLEPPTSKESFRIMANFANSLPENLGLRNQLFYALDNRKPFSHFKNRVDDSDYREAWFAFRDEQLRQWVVERFEEEMNRMEDPD
ncbi:MAG: hypothetical protein JWQ27_753 [Ferruginibacter sp.]|nr:hypothetical protein [Ferruginibacter sp.]